MEPNYERYNKSCDALYYAFCSKIMDADSVFTSTVGMLICNGLRLNIVPEELTREHRYFHWYGYDKKYPEWTKVFITTMEIDPALGERAIMRTNPDKYQGRAQAEIDATGYTWQELSEIDMAASNVDTLYEEPIRTYVGLLQAIRKIAEINAIPQHIADLQRDRFQLAFKEVFA